MGAALRCERDTRWGADQYEPGAVVQRVDERVEPTADERVVHGADGQQVLAVQFVAETERVQHEEQVHLRQAEFDVSTLRPLVPAQQASFAEVVDLGLRREHADLVDPPSEVGGDGDVWRRGDHSLGHLGEGGEVGEDATERLLRRDRLGGEHSRLDRHLDAHPLADRVVVDARADSCAPAPGSGGVVETVPLAAGREAARRAQVVDLR